MQHVLLQKMLNFQLKIADKAEEQAIASDSNQQILNQLPVKSDRGLLKFFLISLLAGFAGVLTPCVFPMIPMTVAFFSQGSENRSKAVFKALIFGISIVLIYSSLGIIVSLTSAGAGFANTLKHSLDSKYSVLCIVCNICNFIFWSI